MTVNIAPTDNRSPFRHNLTPLQVPINALSPLGRDTRHHHNSQIKKLARSLDDFGVILPIVIDENNNIVHGGALVAAARHLGWTDIPAVIVRDLSEAQLRTLRLALNRLSEDAQWNIAELRLELTEILNLDVNLDLTLTGFEMGEIDVVMTTPDVDSGADEHVPAIDRASPAIGQVGDMWLLGPHRLICGDALERSYYSKLLCEELVQMVFTDPPYNLPIGGNVSGLGANTHAEFPMASGEMTEVEYTAFLKTVFSNIDAFSVDGSIHFFCIDWRHLYEMLDVGRDIYSELKNICIWNKNNAGMGSMHRSKHETIPVFKKGTAPHINNIELGKHGRNRTNVWDYPGVNSFGNDRDALLAMHPTVKPVAMVADAILDCSNRGGVILDPFAGSGTAILAAEQTGRCARVIELDPYYVDVSIRRFQDATGIAAVHSVNGRTFADIEADRTIAEDVSHD